MSSASSKLPAGSVVIGQSGGPTAVINQSLVGIVETMRGKPGIEKILGCVRGVSGIVKDEFIELQDLPKDKLERVARTPSAALGSSRDKPDAEYCQKISQSLAKRNTRYFFYIGGNDSSDTCRIIGESARASGYDLRSIHVPKTIDNDLVQNDHTPGFASAARFVAEAFMGDDLDNQALPGVKINVIMGRHAGFLTAASLLARTRPQDGPHLIYVPEVAFNVDKFLGDVDAMNKKHGRCIIAVSEGIHDQLGNPMAVVLAQTTGRSVERDSHGNVQLSGSGALGDFLSEAIKSKLGIKRVRADTFGYLQRAFPGTISPCDAREARGAGRAAARAALSGKAAGSVTIQRTSNDPYRVAYKLVRLSDVAAKTRTLPPEYIQGDNNIAESYRQYLAPLVGELPTLDFLR